ncbi:MAG: SDR family NAD(P)-dependent oxidoreductase [Anaerolineaceae bacterium]|nr:SDR family NAD(P)-dependent oxidoreductase [Anaerolineaceae bacterium]
MGWQPLRGQVALVTGGGGGIGSAICRSLATVGATVVITFNRDQARADALAADLPGAGHLVAQARVEDSSALAALARRVAEGPGRLDLLVNNAGITRGVPHHDLDALDDDLIDSIFRVNVRGAIACVRAMRPLLAAGEGGLVVNISSVAGRTGLGSNIAYCASKAALDNVTKSLARALAPQIRVVSVSPGWVEGEYALRMPPPLIQEQRDKTPLGRIASPEDVAAAVLVVATRLRFTTGAVIPVDGGRPLG